MYKLLIQSVTVQFTSNIVEYMPVTIQSTEGHLTPSGGGKN